MPEQPEPAVRIHGNITFIISPAYLALHKAPARYVGAWHGLPMQGDVIGYNARQQQWLIRLDNGEMVILHDEFVR